MPIGAIVTDETGSKLDYTRSLARALSLYLSAFTLLIGFIMVCWSLKEKGLHDLISGTLVINKK
ncbi:RDD family protein [Anaerobacillus sp. HL2]|nr:RDD family protein [Anaerobacillus sp. HL2]